MNGWLRGKRDAIAFLIYSAVLHIGLLGMVDVLLNFYFVSLGYDVGTIGLLQAVPRLAGFLTSLPIGLIADRIGSRRMIMIASIGAALSMWLLMIPTLPMLALSRFLVGIFYGAQQIALAPLMVALVDGKWRTRFFAYHNVITVVGIAVGSVLGGVLPLLLVTTLSGVLPLESVASASTPFAYGAGLFIASLLVLISVLPLRAVTTETTLNTEKFTLRGNIPWRRLLLVALPMIPFGFSGGLTFPFYNLFFRTQFDASDQTVGTILSIGWLGMAFIPLLNPRLEGWFGRSLALGVAMLIAGGAFLGLSALPPLAISIVLYVIGASFRNIMQPLYQPLVLDSLPVSLHNHASGVNMLLWNIGWFTATALSGVWLRTIGFGGLMLIAAVTVLLTGVLIVAVFRPRRWMKMSEAV